MSVPPAIAGADTPVAVPVSYPKQTAGFYLILSVYWFALSFLWGGMISIVMQTLVEQIVPKQKDLYLGWTLAIGAFVSTLVALIVGTMSDRSRWKQGKRRPYIAVGTVLTVPALLWLAHIHSIPALILDFCLIQFWINVATSPYQALVPDLVPKAKQGAASAYMGMGSLLGQLAGLVLCGMLVSKPGGLQTIVFTLATVLTAAMLFTLVTIRERSAENNPLPPVSPNESIAESFRVSPRDYPDFFWLIASRFAINMGFYTATEFLLYYVKDTLRAPDPTKTVTNIFLITTFSGLLGNFPAGMLSDRMAKKRVVYFSTAITAVAALIFLLTSSIPVALGAAFVFGMGFGAFQAVDWALATNLLPEHDEAKYMGVWHAAFTVPQVVAPLVGGIVAYTFNQHVAAGFGYRAVLFLVLIYLGIGTLLIRPVRERLHFTPDANGPGAAMNATSAGE